MSYFKLPYGIHDILPDEKYNLDLITEKLEKSFKNYGCDSIATPGIEYYDTFSKGKGAINQQNMFKMTDFDGSLLVIRPDVTLAVSRITATKLTDLPQKLCYFENTYEHSKGTGVKLREIYQGGVEFLGLGGSRADAELIALAIESLLSCGLSDFCIEIGQVGFFKGLMEEAGLSVAEIEQIRLLVNSKDNIGVELALKNINAEEKVINSIQILPTLFGGAEVLEKAERLTSNENSLKALKDLNEVYNYLKEFGYEKYITIDLGVVKSLSYYTGIVFSGLTRFLGSSILTGGRYDNLAEDFGKKIESTGFCIGLERLLTALEKQNGLSSIKPPEILVMSEKGLEKECYEFAKEKRLEGHITDVYLGYSKEDFKKYIERKKPINVYYITKDGIEKWQ